MKGSLTLTAACTLEETTDVKSQLLGFRLLVPGTGVIVVRRSTPGNTTTDLAIKHGMRPRARTRTLTASLDNEPAFLGEEQEVDTVALFVAVMQNSIEILRTKPELQVRELLRCCVVAYQQNELDTFLRLSSFC